MRISWIKSIYFWHLAHIMFWNRMSLVVIINYFHLIFSSTFASRVP